MTPPVERSPQDEVIICQLARLGDLAQTLRLIERISADRISLICDAAIEDWARLMPRVCEIHTLDTRKWRSLSLGNLDLFPRLLEGLKSEIPYLRSGPQCRLLLLNDHPLVKALTAYLCGDDAGAWLTPELVLLRSYINLTAAQQKMNRIHLADLWASLDPGSADRRMELVKPTAQAQQFAETHLGRRRGEGSPVWTIILGSGAPHRRIEPECFANWMLRLPAEDRPRIVLLGGPGEEPLAERFLKKAGNHLGGIINLTGKCLAENTIGVFVASDWVLGVDTGTLHWAAAAGCRVVGFYFGEAGLHSTGPYGEGHLVVAPDCADYPCHPSRAAQCQWRCRQAYDQPEIADILLCLLRQRPLKQLPRIKGLQVHASSVKRYGNLYAPIEGEREGGEFEAYAHFSRLALGLYKCPADGFEATVYDGEKIKSIRLLCQIWESEIEQLALPKVLQVSLIQEIKSQARRRLAETFAKYSPHEHTSAERRLLSGQPAAVGA